MPPRRQLATKVIIVTALFIPLDIAALHLIGEPITPLNVGVIIASFILADIILIVYGEKLFKTRKKKS